MEVITAKDGVEAIARLQGRTPDIMLLVSKMPRMDDSQVATLVGAMTSGFDDLPRSSMITRAPVKKHRGTGAGDWRQRLPLASPIRKAQCMEAIRRNWSLGLAVAPLSAAGLGNPDKRRLWLTEVLQPLWLQSGFRR